MLKLSFNGVDTKSERYVYLPVKRVIELESIGELGMTAPLVGLCKGARGSVGDVAKLF